MNNFDLFLKYTNSKNSHNFLKVSFELVFIREKKKRCTHKKFLILKIINIEKKKIKEKL
jgi:hypothetical protein